MDIDKTVSITLHTSAHSILKPCSRGLTIQYNMFSLLDNGMLSKLHAGILSPIVYTCSEALFPCTSHIDFIYASV